METVTEAILLDNGKLLIASSIQYKVSTFGAGGLGVLPNSPLGDLFP